MDGLLRLAGQGFVIVVGAAVVLLLLWIWAHSWMVRPFIRRAERAWGFQFPFIDRIWPR